MESFVTFEKVKSIIFKLVDRSPGLWFAGQWDMEAKDIPSDS